MHEYIVLRWTLLNSIISHLKKGHSWAKWIKKYRVTKAVFFPKSKFSKVWQLRIMCCIHCRPHPLGWLYFTKTPFRHIPAINTHTEWQQVWQPDWLMWRRKYSEILKYIGWNSTGFTLQKASAPYIYWTAVLDPGRLLSFLWNNVFVSNERGYN